MSARVGNLTFDCDDALVVARFWSSVLGGPLEPGGNAGFATIGVGVGVGVGVGDAARSEPAWLFDRVHESNIYAGRVGPLAPRRPLRSRSL